MSVGVPSDLLSTVAYLGLAMSAVIMSVVGIRLNRPPDALPWLLLAAGLFLFMAGDLYFSLAKLVWHVERPFPSVADVLFVSSYPALAAGVLLLAHRRDPGGDRVGLIDALIVATAAALLLWVYIIAPTAIRTDGPVLERALAAGYPMLDVLLVGVTMRLALGHGSRQASYYFLSMAMLSLVAADVVYAVYQLLPSGSLPAVEPADVGWLGFYLFVAVAALHPSMRGVAAESADESPGGRGRLLVLGALALVAPAVLAVEYARGDSRETVVIVVATMVLFVLVTARIRELVVRLEQARGAADAANEAKGAFLSTMTHELRTPMHAVISVSELLRDSALDPEQQALNEVMVESGRAMLGVVENILDFSKIEAGMMDLEHRPFDLDVCIESALDVVAVEACAKRIELAYEIDPEVPVHLLGDRTRLGQILLNLLANAVKFTDEGEVVLTATRGEVAAGADPTIHFAVRDTGIGMAADEVDDLFRPYHQGVSSTNRQYRGTGLGLAISRRLAAAMGGRIWVASEVGQGSTFHLTVVAHPASPAGPPDDDSRFPPLDGRRLSVVGDNPRTRGIVERLVTRWGMTVDPGSGVVDGMVVDLGSGGTVGSPTVPVVALVPIDRLGDQVLGDRSPAAVLAKPVKPAQLRAALVTVLGAGGPEPPTPDRPGLRRSLRILVADDNPVNQKVTALLLDRLGHRADVVGDGDQVLGALRRRHYDVVLMDVAMRGMDGVEATGRIRREWAPADQPRIIALTASARSDERERVMAAGMNGLLGKPVDIDALADALARCPGGGT